MRTRSRSILRSISVLALASMLFSASGCQKTVNKSDVTAKADSNVSSSGELPAESSESRETESSAAVPSVPEEPSKAEESSELSVFDVPYEFRDNGLFSEYYEDCYKKIVSMPLDEKIGQMLWSSCPLIEAPEMAAQYNLGGYVLFSNNFEGQTKYSLSSEFSRIQNLQKIPMAFAVDEEGGTVTRISSKTAFAEHEFESPRTLYKWGKLPYIQSDADEKASLLKELRIDLNLAPVCDISTNKKDFMYDRSLGEDPKITSEFVKIVTEVSQKKGVSVTLKHFPGYGSNVDTHTGVAVDERKLDYLKKNDLLPFQTGIDSKAHFVMMSHNIIKCMDENAPASLSPKVHEYLRKEMGFTGIIITDDLSMGAIAQYAGEHSPAVAAVLAGNDVLILTNSMIESSINSIKAAVEDGTIDESVINHAVMRILSWKRYKGIL